MQRVAPTLSAEAEDEDDSDDDDDDDGEIATDHALALFLRRPPTSADHWVCVAYTAAGEQVVQDRSALEARTRPVDLANETYAACQRWATAEGRKTRFRVTWQAADRVLASHQWTSGEGDPSALDGTVESFLSQQQRHAETQHRLHHEGFSMVQDAWKQLLAASMKRIEALERDNETLRDRLRKAGDVEADIAVQQVAAELEQRNRTADILEHKVLPIAQALILRRLAGDDQPPPSAAPAANVNQLAAATEDRPTTE